MAMEKMEGGYYDIDPQDVELGKYCIVDVREPHEWVGELGHIEGSEFQPLATFLEKGFPTEIAKEQPILFICRSGRRSARAALTAIHELGYQEAYNLRGGMIAWNQAELPIRQEIKS